MAGRSMTMPRPSIRQRMKSQKRLIDAQAQAAGEMLAERELAIRLLLKRLGGSVTITAEEIEAVGFGRVAYTKTDGGVRWEYVGADVAAAAPETPKE